MPGKRTLTENLASASAASAAGNLQRESALKTLQRRLDDPMKQVGDAVREKVVDKILEPIEKLVDRLIDDVDELAQTTIDDGLKRAKQECPTEAKIKEIEGAIDSRRMIAAFHMLNDVDEAVKSAIAALHGEDSPEGKFKKFENAIGDMIKALRDFADEIDKTNTEHQRLAAIAAKCPKQPELNPQLRVFTVPKPLEKMPHDIKLPPSIHPPKPDHIIGVPSPLIEIG